MRKRLSWPRGASILLVLSLCAILLSPTTTQAQGNGFGPEISSAVKHDVSPALGHIPAVHPGRGPLEIPLRPIPPPASNVTDPVRQTTVASTVAASLLLNFAGVGNGDYSYTVSAAPPDTNLAVGATQVVQWVNLSFAVFDKTGNLLYGPAAGSTLWSGFGGGCQNNNSGDPIVQYDRAAGRWVMAQPVYTTPYLYCIAVSTSSDATGTWNRYAFSFSNTQFPDYPKIGIWSDGYYASFNMFQGGRTFSGAKVCAYDKSAMLAGASAAQVCFQLSKSYASLLPSDLDGSTAPPSGSPSYFVNYGANSLRLWQFHVDWGTPANSTFTGPTNVQGVAAFNAACGGGACIPQPGTTQQLDSLADRLMYRLAYRNFGTYESLVVNHSVNPGNNTSAIRWYELRNPRTAPTVYQQGTYAPDSNYRWMGSIAQDKMGNIAVGYSESNGTSLYPSIFYTGRVITDPLGILAGENRIFAGGGSQLRRLSRWGDYSAMRIDPVDDCTFFYTTEYLKSSGTFNWSTRIASFKFASCQ